MNKWIMGCAVGISIVLGSSCAKGTESAKKPNMTIDLPGLPADATPLELVWIPAGTFMMGSPDSDKNRMSSETPQHSVTLTQDFYLGKYEVTQAQWQAVMKSNPSQFADRPNRPVEKVSWEDCRKFIERLNELKKGHFRFPTEAEWEYAARAGTTTPYYWGETPFNPLQELLAQSNSQPQKIVPTPNGIWITDNPDSWFDLSGKEDVDPANDRELTIRWNLLDKRIVDVHIYMLVDDATQPIFLGRTANGTDTFFRWRSGNTYLNQPFSTGPESGHTYRFSVFGLIENAQPIGPFYPAGAVYFDTLENSQGHSPAPNGFGLINISWNVWEWCQDWFDEHYYAVSPEKDPLNHQPGIFRVCRGGSIYNSPQFQRSAARGKGNPNQPYYYIGLRLAWTSTD